MSKENIQKLIDTVESIENDFKQGVNTDNITNSIDSAFMVIKLAKTNPNNNIHEGTLCDLELRLSSILLKL